MRSFTSRELKSLHSLLWKKGVLHWKLHEGQQKIYGALRELNPSVQEALVFCARRFGKSTLGVIMALEDCIRNERVQVRIIGPTIKQTISIVEPIIRKLAFDSPQGMIRRIKSEYRWKVALSELIVGGFDGQNITRHLGQESYSIYLEESGAAKAEDFNYAIVEVLTPQLLHTRGRKIHLTTPPLQLDHPLLTEVLPEAKEKGAFFHYTVFENPLLTQQQIEDAVRESGGSETAAFKRNYLCEIVKDESTLVVPQFEEEKHVFKEELLLEGQKVFVVGDLGGVVDKTVLLLCTKHNSILYVHEELVYPAQTESKRMFVELFQRSRERKVILNQPFFIDAPHAMTIDWLNQFKVSVSVPKKKTFLEGITFLRQLFFRGDVRISGKCEFLIKSLSFGSLNSTHKDFERSEALGHCDALAALIYASRSVLESESLHHLSLKPLAIEDKFVKALQKKHNEHRANFELFLSGKTEMKSLFKNRKR